jgi:hypothetical protein
MSEEKLEANTSKREFKKLTKYCLGAGAFMAVGLLITTYTQLLETVSSSLKGINYILVRKSSSIQRGDIVSIQGHTIKYVGEKLIAKRVLGLPGDRIIQDEGQIILIPSDFDPELLKYLKFQPKRTEFEVSEDIEDVEDTDDQEECDDQDDEEDDDDDDDENTAPESFSVEESSIQHENIVSIQEHTNKYVGFNLELLQFLGSRHFGIEIFPLLKQTKEGNPLIPLSVKKFSEGRNPEGIIPPGYVFVAGDNPNSFDSRYEEFGLVPMEKIWGKAIVTW